MTVDIVVSNRNLRPVKIKSYGECRVLMVGNMEIWDGAELALVRETMRRLVEEEECRTLGIDMNYVKYIPSGFFGTLCEWHDKDICIRLFGPLPHVRQMLWFTRFFHSIGDEFYELRPSFESDFNESASECAEADEPVSTSNSLLTLNEERTSSVPIQANGKAEFSATAPLQPW